MNCAFPECDCTDAEIVIMIGNETNHYCCQIHAAMALLIDAGMAERWIFDEIQQRVCEAKEARSRRKPSSQLNAVAPLDQSA